MAKRKPIAVIDAETDPFMYGSVPEPFVWGYYDGVDYDVFWGEDGICTEALIDHLNEREVIIYAHNGGKFDFFYLLPYLDKGNIQLINGRISQAKIGLCSLRDSYNIIPIPQKHFGKDEIEYWKFKKEFRNEHRAEILSYLQTDCFELYDIVNEFCDRFGRKLTIATAAMHRLKTIIEEDKMRSFDRFSEIQDERFRPYYFGGRCQAFEKGELKGDWEIVDINSAYPRAMLDEHPDPTYNSFYIDDNFPKNKKCYFAKIRAISSGALPWRDPEAKIPKLEFPADNIPRVFHATGWEIEVGLRTKTLEILEIIEVRIPDKTTNFSLYVLPLYEEKKKAKAVGKKSDEIFAKLLLNSPYGKFAIDPRTFKIYELTEYGDLPSESINEDKPHLWRQNSSWPEYDLDVWECPKHLPKEFYEDEEDYISVRGFYNVSVAASITGWVRAYLWESICSSERPIYTDTDSIICKKFNGVLGKELGEWDLEGKADVAYIGGRKMYAFRITEGKGVTYFRDKMLNEIRSKEATEGRRWKVATKGARLHAGQLISMVRHGKVIEWENAAPTNSLRFGTRFLKRRVKMT